MRLGLNAIKSHQCRVKSPIKHECCYSIKVRHTVPINAEEMLAHIVFLVSERLLALCCCMLKRAGLLYFSITFTHPHPHPPYFFCALLSSPSLCSLHLILLLLDKGKCYWCCASGQASDPKLDWCFSPVATRFTAGWASSLLLHAPSGIELLCMVQRLSRAFLLSFSHAPPTPTIPFCTPPLVPLPLQWFLAVHHHWIKLT